MSTMDGIKVHVDTAELREHLLQRVSYHSERADYYAKRFEHDRELEGELAVAQSYSNSARAQLQSSEQAHRRSAGAFKFMADHLFEGITYILDDEDLRKLEVGG